MLKTRGWLFALILIATACFIACSSAESGSCGTGTSWTLDEDGLLTISGTGGITGKSWPADKVKNVIIESGVTSIWRYMFQDCSNLQSVTIAESVERIEEWVFAGCSSLKSITLPAGLTSIEDYTFSGCISLENVTIPEGVTSIGDSAFSGCESLASITIPDSVTSIGDSAFSRCESLASIIIPDSVTSIGIWVFKDCSSLISITIPEGVTSIREYAFYDCSSLMSITIPASVTSIGEYAFYDCSSLTSITIPESVTSIGEHAFYFCSSLTAVTIPEGVTSIEEYAFNFCSSLTSITIPEGVATIGNNAFSNCKSLTDITIPEGVTSIGKYAFNFCSNLTAVTLPEGLTSIEEGIFSFCWNLLSAEIPDGVTNIGNSAFNNCVNLTSIVIPESATSIEDFAFNSCRSLTSITIPEGVTSIGDSAFSGCESLMGITIPESVTSIGENAFSSCRGLISITIPDSVSSVGASAFNNCGKLEKICFMGKNTEIGEFAVSNAPTVYCYSDSAAYGWAMDQELEVVLLDSADPLQYLTLTLPETLRIPADRDTLVPYDIFTVSQPGSVRWESGDTLIVTVNQEGNLSPVHTGTAVVTLTVDGKKASTVVTVCPLAEDIILPDMLFTMPGSHDFNELCPIRTYPDNALFDFSVEVENTNIADTLYVYSPDWRPYPYMLLAGYAVGQTNITVSDRLSGLEKTVPVRVGRSIAAASFDQKNVTIRIGQRTQLIAHVTMGQYQFENQLVSFYTPEGETSPYISFDPYTGKILGISEGLETIYLYGRGSDILDTCTITVIGDSNVATLRLPRDLTDIGDEAFRGNSAENIVISFGTKTIGAYAFADGKASYLTVHIPSSVASIDPTAFSGCADVVIFGSSGSAAEAYAAIHANCSFIAE